MKSCGHTRYPFKKALLALSLFCVSRSLVATPMRNIQDTQPSYTLMGLDKFYVKRNKTALTFHVSPFFQHTATASSDNQRKVPAGNIDGRWNMFALFFNRGTTFPITTFPTFNAAFTAISSPAITTPFNGKNFTQETSTISGIAVPYDPTNGALDALGTYQSVNIEYEKRGLRTQVNVDFPFGLGIALKTGVDDYKQIPTFALDSNLAQAVTGTDGGDSGTSSLTPEQATAAKTIYNVLMAPYPRWKIAKELGLNIDEVRETSFEDIHLNLYWHIPYDIKDKDRDIICTVVPYIALGGWLPTGDARDINRPFTAATGNDNHAALTLDGSFSIDFPKIIQISAGIGGAFFMSKTLNNYRVPISYFQHGIIPWKTSISRQPGPMWYANLSFKSEHFIPDFSFYFDFMYTRFTKDTIKLRESNAAKAALFLPQKLERESIRKSQVVNLGVKYDVSPHVAVGITMQGCINGSRIYRPTTALGSLIITF